MIQCVNPISKACGHVRLPGSKSITNRALLLAALAKGTTTLTGVLNAEDSVRMLESLEKLGLCVTKNADSAVVSGCAGNFPCKNADLFVGNAGTVTRTLTAALAFAGGTYAIDGIERMRNRPIGDLVEALRRLGANITYLGKEGYPPLAFAPSVVCGNRVSVRGNVSSQFLTALLMTAPTLQVADASELYIDIEGELISRPYIEMTVRMMQAFGAEVSKTQSGYSVVLGKGYTSPGNYNIEGDASGASYFLALGALTGGPVTVEGVGENSIQGDIEFARVLKSMGAEVEFTETSVTVSRDPQRALKGIDINAVSIPDAAMTFVPMALMCEGEIRISGIGSWRVKETDRIEAMVTEMKKFGAHVQSGPDWICVRRAEKTLDAEVATYNDHRMAMALSLAACAGVSVRVQDPQCVQKTFPTYFEELGKLIKE